MIRLALIKPDAIAADPEAIEKRMSDCKTLSEQIDVVCSEQWTIPADCLLEEHLKAQNEGKVARNSDTWVLLTPRPQLVEHNSQTYLVFATRGEENTPTLRFMNLNTMKDEMQIPEALLFLEFTPSGDL